MVKKRTAKSKKSSAAEVRMVLDYLDTLTHLEAVIDGAILAGMHPYAFEAITSFLFMEAVAESRADSPEKIVRWMISHTEHFTPILDNLIAFAQSYRGELLPDADAIEDFDTLFKPQFQIPLSEIELKRQQKIIEHLMHYCLQRQSRRSFAPEITELVYLIIWLKVAALSGDIPKEVYLTLRSTVPFFVGSYDDMVHALLDQID